MSKTTDQIIAAANDRAADILRVYSAKVRTMHDAAAIAANALQNASGSKNIDNLYRIAGNATAAANSAIDANDEAWTAAQFAAEYVRKASRTAAAYKAAATRAGFTAEAIAKRDAAAEALAIIEDAYHVAEEERSAGNRAMNAAIKDAREVIKIAKLTAAAEKARETIANYPATTEDDAREIIRRELDARSNDIDAAAKDWHRAMLDNETAAAKVAAYAFATEAEQAKEDEIADRSAKLATTRTRHMNIGEMKQQAHTIDGINGWSARVEYAPHTGNNITNDWRVEVYRNGIYICHDIFWTIEEAEAYAEAMAGKPSPEDIANEAMQEAEKAMQEASEAERKTADAAIMYDTESAAAFAAEARRAAIKAEQAASKAAAAAHEAGTPDAAAVADIVSEYAAIARRDADRATETAEQNAAELEERAQIIDQIEDPQHREYIRATAEAHQWTPEETRENIAYYAANRAANRAAFALIDAYAEAIGEHPTEDDPETRAAYRVAHDEITGTSSRATEYDRETVDLMTEAIARSARRPDLSKYESMPYLEIGPAVYQPAELLAYLGEPEDYDVAAIEAEATAYDPATGARIWVAFGDDLAAIAERHQTATYYPAAV